MFGSIGSALGGIAGSLIGQKVQQGNQKALIDQQEKLQKQFAKQGIQWRVADAQKAGIHPLYALGASTSSYTPQQVGMSTGGGDLAAMGQDILGAVNRGSSRADRLFNTQQRTLSLERMGLENDLLKAQIANQTSQLSAPALPSQSDHYLIGGQGDAAGPRVQDIPLRRVASAPGAPHAEGGAVPEVGFGRTTKGWAPTMSRDFKDRAEDDLAAEISWNIRNRLLPESLGGSWSPPPIKLPAGHEWAYDPIRQEYYQRPAKRKKAGSWKDYSPRKQSRRPTTPREAFGGW